MWREAVETTAIPNTGHKTPSKTAAPGAVEACCLEPQQKQRVDPAQTDNLKRRCK
jgi:hypothetical protein